MKYTLSSSKNVSGEISVPGDKSISQRAFLLNSIANGIAHVGNICVGDDKASILRCLINVPNGGKITVARILNILVGKQKLPYPKPPYINLSNKVHSSASILSLFPILFELVL